MTRTPIRSLATAAAALLVSSALLVASVHPANAQSAEVGVRYKDLNLAQPADVATLDRRIRSAAAAACPAATGSRLNAIECRTEVAAQLRATIEKRLATAAARTGA